MTTSVHDFDASLASYRPGEDLLSDFLARPLVTCLAAHRASGPISRVRFGGEDVVMIGGREANLFVWANADAWDYPRSNVAFAEQLTIDHLDAASGLRHRRRRQVMNPSFSRESVTADLPVLAARLQAEVPRAAAAGPVDFLRFWMELLTRHRCQTAAVVDLDDADVRVLTEWQFQFIYGITLGDARHTYYARAEYRTLRQRAMTIFTAVAEERLAAPEKHDDELAQVLQRRAQLAPADGLPGLSLEAVADDVYLMLVAGVDNVQTVLVNILQEVIARPELGDRLLAELAGWDGQDPLPLVTGRWWNATLTEIHRLRPQVPATTATMLYPLTDLTFEGRRIAAGTPVLHPMVLTQVMEEFYPEPFEFRPERFLDGASTVPGTFGAFGGGPHLCIGRNVGNLQGALIAATLLVGYDIDGISAPDPDLPVGDRSTRHLDHHWVTLRPRIHPVS